LRRNERDAINLRTPTPLLMDCVGGNPAVRREMVWVETEGFRCWACSECAWKFNPSGVPTGDTIDEMKQKYERQRDREFASHLCAGHPRVQKLSASRG
jgi:Fe-S oxidoreductase